MAWLGDLAAGGYHNVHYIFPSSPMPYAWLRDDVAALDLTGADGIGLFRTEFQFLVSATLPQRERQQRLYRDVLDAAYRIDVRSKLVRGWSAEDMENNTRYVQESTDLHDGARALA